jgi:two-component system chemotaxis response regulator CheB
MALRPMPVVVVSTLTQRGTEVAIRALELGAVEIVGKPVLHVENEIERLKTELIGKIRIAARSKPRARMPVEAQPALIMDRAFSSEGRIVAIGASTGGVEALQKLISPLPVDSPPILVTQHMPQGFTSSFSRRLDQVSQMSVCEATDQQRVLPGHVYVAPGNLHLELARYGAHYICRVHDGATVSGHRPSVDVLFHSVAVTAGANAMGIILTGMGKDGAAGLLEMRKAGAHSFGESEVSCLIYGMPRVAKEMGATECEGDLSFLAHQIIMKRGVQNN